MANSLELISTIFNYSNEPFQTLFYPSFFIIYIHIGYIIRFLSSPRISQTIFFNPFRTNNQKSYNHFGFRSKFLTETLFLQQYNLRLTKTTKKTKQNKTNYSLQVLYMCSCLGFKPFWMRSLFSKPLFYTLFLVFINRRDVHHSHFTRFRMIEKWMKFPHRPHKCLWSIFFCFSVFLSFFSISRSFSLCMWFLQFDQIHRPSNVPFLFVRVFLFSCSDIFKSTKHTQTQSQWEL